MNLTNTQIESLNGLYTDIELANISGADEVNINGNGCSAFEVSRCIDAVYDILGLTRPVISKKMVKEYCKEHGID